LKYPEKDQHPGGKGYRAGYRRDKEQEQTGGEYPFPAVDIRKPARGNEKDGHRQKITRRNPTQQDRIYMEISLNGRQRDVDGRPHKGGDKGIQY